MGAREAVEMVYCLRNHQFGCRHRSKSSRADKYLNLQTTDSNYTEMGLAVAVPENDHGSCRPHGRAAVAYIAAESITSSRFTCDEVLPSKWSIACAITNLAVDIGRRAAGQINTSIFRLLIQTTQTCSLPLRYPIMITAAVDLMVEQQ